MIKSNQYVEGENSMEKSPNKEILDKLNSIKKNLEDLYNKYKVMYDNAKNDAEVKSAIDGANIIISKHKAVVSDLKKYHSLFTALYTPEYNGNADIINQINALEKEILEKYKDKYPAKSAAETSGKDAPAIKKGEKHAVTKVEESKTAKNNALTIASSIGAVILATLTLSSLANINVSTVGNFFGSIIPYGLAAAASGWGAIATGSYAVQRFKEESHSKSK